MKTKIKGLQIRKKHKLIKLIRTPNKAKNAYFYKL